MTRGRRGIWTDQSRRETYRLLRSAEEKLKQAEEERQQREREAAEWRPAVQISLE